ncbi:MAG: Ig-like domain-containing protein [Chloroflexota bacterium]|nr:Ig-like domain-containing protein [Chloroflexota bacterium]
MRAVVLRSLAVIGIGGLLLGGILYVASTVDGRPPSVLGIALTQPLPDDPARGLPTTSLEITFTEPVDAETAADALSVEPAVEGAISWSGSVMIFTPDAPLELATGYTVSVGTGIEDLAGNRMTQAPAAFNFETTGPPQVVETEPADGAGDVGLTAPIQVRFSTLMDTASVEAALRLLPAFDHSLRWSGQLLEIVPTQPLAPETEYRVEIGEDAFDTSGVALGEQVRIGFRTIEPGLDLSQLVPTDGSDGIAPTSSIALFFDRPIDPETVSGDLLTITPAVAGSTELVDELGNQPAEPEDGRVLRFTPSGPLPANTTFTVGLAPGITGLAGGGLAEQISWTFTTGAPQPTLSNQVVFLSKRAGIPNLWAMNADGTAAHQLSTELTPILDYAVAPDGSSFVVGDGRRLVLVNADGTDRRVLTDEAHLEFDPAYAPNGQRLAFARSDAASGRGLGIWERQIPGDGATPVELPPTTTASPGPDGSPDGEVDTSWARAPRYSPDGEALAFIDPAGSVGIVDESGEEVTRVAYLAMAPPIWLPDSSAILLTGRATERTRDVRALEAPVGPLEPGVGVEVATLERSGSSVEEAAFGAGIAVTAVAPDGRIAHLGRDGSLRISDAVSERGSVPRGLAEVRIGGVAFAPGEDAIVVVVLEPDAGDDTREGRIERVELGGLRREVMANDGWAPRWLP